MASFAERLLVWYKKHKRSLPWREESNPYRVWLSEMMLQQTQVETVIPYYYRWLEMFPTIESVASASQDKVLKAWEGLGYYSRCRNFHQACKIVVNKHDGQIPDTWVEFHQLPGVGDYTASAVLSFAFGQPYPVLDGNVMRVMARILAFPKPVEKGKKIFISKLKAWIDLQNAGDFNQAMMDLGSLVCRRNQPHCFSPQNPLDKRSFEECPVRDFCEGYKKGEPERFPVRSKTKIRPHKTIVAGIIWNGGKFLIQRRPENGLLGGLWEFPGGKALKGESLEEALVREIREETGLHIMTKNKIGEVNHAYTHFSITLHAYHCSVLDGTQLNSSNRDRKWITLEEIPNYAFPKANHKLFSLMSARGAI